MGTGLACLRRTPVGRAAKEVGPRRERSCGAFFVDVDVAAAGFDDDDRSGTDGARSFLEDDLAVCFRGSTGVVRLRLAIVQY